MAGHCCSEHKTFDGLSPEYRRALMAVIAINALMFLIEMPMGFVGQSEALKADALDFIGDTVTYSLSFMVIGMSLATRARMALLKGYSLGLLGAWVLCNTAYSFFVQGEPSATIMGGIGLLALSANLASVFILRHYKDGDANVRSVWLCSRNDAINNCAVMVAGVAVWFTNSLWPDLIVAGIMASLFLTGAIEIIKRAKEEIVDVKQAASCTRDNHQHAAD